MKAQTAFEYSTILIIALVIAIIVVAAYYNYESSLSHSVKSVSYPITDFSLLSYNKNVTTDTCEIGFSFESQANISIFPIEFKIDNPNGIYMFLPINSSTYTGYSYETPSNNYFYNYTGTSDSINETTCDLFTSVINASTGTITGVVSMKNGQKLLYDLSTPFPTLIP